MRWYVSLLLPNRGGDLQDMVLVEVLWKLITIIIDGNIQKYISTHGSRHVLLSRRWEVTATIGEKFHYNLKTLQHIHLYQICLLNINKGEQVQIQILCLIRVSKDTNKFIPKKNLKVLQIILMEPISCGTQNSTLYYNGVNTLNKV